MKALTPTLSRGRGETQRGPLLPRGEGGPKGRMRAWPLIDALDWPALERELDAFGCAVAPKLLTAEDCRGPGGAVCRTTRASARAS